MGASQRAWEELVRVPLIVAGPETDSKKVSEKFSLMDLPRIVKGEKPEKLTREKVFSMYRGARGFGEMFGEFEEPEGEEALRYFRNKSNAVVEQGKLSVQNTEIPNFEYTVYDERKGDYREIEDVPNSIKIRFGEDLDQLEF